MFEVPRIHSPDERLSRPTRPRRAKSEPKVATYAEVDGIGMGLLSDGEPYLTQRGLAALCGVQNAHIGNISRDWTGTRPRVKAIKDRLGFRRAHAHRVLSHAGHRLFAYDLAIAQAVLDYYALDVAKPEAVRNRSRFSDGRLRGHILAQFDVLSAPATPLRFEPVATPQSEDTQDAVTAFLTQIWTLYVISFWMAVHHIEAMRNQVAQAPWNRLGLYLPLKAFLEIQAEFLRRNGTFTLR